MNTTTNEDATTGSQEATDLSGQRARILKSSTYGGPQTPETDVESIDGHLVSGSSLESIRLAESPQRRAARERLNNSSYTRMVGSVKDCVAAEREVEQVLDFVDSETRGLREILAESEKKVRELEQERDGLQRSLSLADDDLKLVYYAISKEMVAGEGVGREALRILVETRAKLEQLRQDYAVLAGATRPRRPAKRAKKSSKSGG